MPSLPPDSVNQIAAFARQLEMTVNAGLCQRFNRPISDLTALISILNWNTFNISWLANVLELTHSATVRLVDRMEADGLISRMAKDAKKQVGLSISDKGRVLADEVLKLRHELASSVLQPLNVQQVQTLAELARIALNANVQDEPAAYKTCALCDEVACGAGCPTAPVVSLVGFQPEKKRS